MDPAQASFEPPPHALDLAPNAQSLPDPSLPQAISPADHPKHVVVVRSHEAKWLRRLWLPILMALFAVAGFSYRLHAPDWFGLFFPVPHAQPGQIAQKPMLGEAAHASFTPSDDVTHAIPVVAERVKVTVYSASGEEGSDMAAAGAPTLAPAAVPQPVESGAAAGTPAGGEWVAGPGTFAGMVRIREPSDLLAFTVFEFLGYPAKPELEPLASDIARDILREAELARQNEAELNRVKQDQLARDDQAAAERKANEAWVQRAQDFRARAKFRDTLRTLMREADHKREPYRQTAARLLDLCHKSGQNLDWTHTFTARNVTVLTRQKRAQLVEKLRKEHRAESAILVELARLERRNVAARNGPRDGDEALVRAARQLLAVPLTDAAALQAARPPQPDAALLSAPAPLARPASAPAPASLPYPPAARPDPQP